MIVFDLDGTLAIDEHRVHFLRQEPKDWASYFAACDKDACNYIVRGILFALRDATAAKIVIWTGRSAEVEEKTIAWLKAFGIWEAITWLKMRPIGDRTDDTEMKKAWAQQTALLGDPVEVVFEDRQRVVNMWRAMGIQCLQVAPGDF